MPYCFLLPIPVKVVLPRGQIAVMIVEQKLSHERHSFDSVFGVADYLDAITGGNNHAFQNALPADQVSERLGQARFMDVHPLAHFDRCRAMIHSYKDEVHTRSRIIARWLLAPDSRTYRAPQQKIRGRTGNTCNASCFLNRSEHSIMGCHQAWENSRAGCSTRSRPRTSS